MPADDRPACGIGSAAQQHAERPDDTDTDTARDAHANDRRHAKCAAHSVSFGEVSIMAIDVKASSYELGKTVTYVTVNGVKHTIERADSSFRHGLHPWCPEIF